MALGALATLVEEADRVIIHRHEIDVERVMGHLGALGPGADALSRHIPIGHIPIEFVSLGHPTGDDIQPEAVPLTDVILTRLSL